MRMYTLYLHLKNDTPLSMEVKCMCIGTHIYIIDYRTSCTYLKIIIQCNNFEY